MMENKLPMTDDEIRESIARLRNVLDGIARKDVHDDPRVGEAQDLIIQAITAFEEMLKLSTEGGAR